MNANNKNNLIAIFAIAALYSGTLAFAANDMNSPPQKLTPQEKTVNRDFSKVSADGSGAFMDLTLTRLAVFDGRIDAAKKYIGNAEKTLTRAKTDETRFLRDEAHLNATKNTPMNNGGATPPTANQRNSSNNNQQNSSNNQQNSSNNNQQNASNIEWLPVDASITINEDFSASPEKKAAVADANKSLSKGDRKGSIDKLKVSGVNIDVAVLAVPLNETIAKVQQAATMINDGKYYEASQLIKQVQDSARSDVMDFNGMPTNRARNQGASRTEEQEEQ
jgi:hypothetical protein